MKDLEKLTIDDFQACLEQIFILEQEGIDALGLRLIQVKTLGKIVLESKRQQPFSLLFQGPLEPMLQQQLYRISNDRLGDLELFLVPVGLEENAMLYDATFG